MGYIMDDYEIGHAYEYENFPVLLPYHTLLLLEDPEEILRDIPLDANPTLVKLVQILVPYQWYIHDQVEESVLIRDVHEMDVLDSARSNKGPFSPPLYLCIKRIVLMNCNTSWTVPWHRSIALPHI